MPNVFKIKKLIGQVNTSDRYNRGNMDRTIRMDKKETKKMADDYDTP